MHKPVISVVIPAHNQADFLPMAIESALRQGGSELDAPDALEVIVVDDASTDGTQDVLAGLRGAVRAIRNAESRERGSSRNMGAAAARGQWVAFLDSDDEWDDGKLAAQLAAVGAAKACLTACWVVNREGGGIGVDRRGRPDPIDQIDVMNTYRGVASALLIDRRLFLELEGFPEDREVQGSEDWLFMVKLVRAGVFPVLVEEPLVRYRLHGENSTASPDRCLRSGLAGVDWLERNGLTTPHRAASARAEKYEAAARGYALRGDLTRALRCMRQATRLVPTRKGKIRLLENTARDAVSAGLHRAPQLWLESD